MWKCSSSQRILEKIIQSIGLDEELDATPVVKHGHKVGNAVMRLSCSCMLISGVHVDTQCMPMMKNVSQIPGLDSF